MAQGFLADAITLETLGFIRGKCTRISAISRPHRLEWHRGETNVPRRISETLPVGKESSFGRRRVRRDAFETSPTVRPCRSWPPKSVYRISDLVMMAVTMNAGIMLDGTNVFFVITSRQSRTLTRQFLSKDPLLHHPPGRVLFGDAISALAMLAV